jgi:Tol biopolymer transport system component
VAVTILFLTRGGGDEPNPTPPASTGATVPPVAGVGRIAFLHTTSDGTEVAVREPDGTVRTLTNDGREKSRLRWDEDGSLSFIETGAGDVKTPMIVPADGSAPQKPDDRIPAGAQGWDWLPDGGLVYASITEDNARIYRTDPSDPSGEPETVVELGGDLGTPDDVRVSPDGTMAAYTVGAFDPERQGLWIAPLGGGEPFRVGDAPDGFAWSPTDDRLVVGLPATNRDDHDVVVYDASAREFQADPVVGTALDESNPSWTPDGSRIVFTRDSGNGKTALFWIRPDRSGEQPLPDVGADATDSEPAAEPPRGQDQVT